MKEAKFLTQSSRLLANTDVHFPITKFSICDATPKQKNKNCPEDPKQKCSWSQTLNFHRKEKKYMSDLLLRALIRILLDTERRDLH
jgi:hypothetical protein